MENRPVFVWLSRHALTQPQIDQLIYLGIDPTDIHQPGDVNAFSVADIEATVGLVASRRGPLSRVIVGVVHPAAALHLHNAGYTVAVAENVNRAEEGEKPRFEFETWHIF